MIAVVSPSRTHLERITVKQRRTVLSIAAILFLALSAGLAPAQKKDGKGRARGTAKPVTVPVTIKLRGKPEEMQTVDFLIREDGEMQQILSIRRPSENPISLAILLQDDLVSSIGTEVRGVADFVRHLPNGSRVMIGYIRSGSLDLRRKFTPDLDRAASGLRPPLGLASAGPFNPFVEIIEALHRFDSQPAGRRALIVVSDGLDISRGADNSAPGQSVDLDRAISEAQRRSVAIYSIYAPSADSVPQLLAANGQSCLEKLSAETGGVAFFQGTGAPVSFDPFLNEIDASLSRQIALTYLSTHTGKGFHRLEIKPLERNFEVRAPVGFLR
jgi:hypothetical protein